MGDNWEHNIHVPFFEEVFYIEEYKLEGIGESKVSFLLVFNLSVTIFYLCANKHDPRKSKRWTIYKCLNIHDLLKWVRKDEFRCTTTGTGLDMDRISIISRMK